MIVLRNGAVVSVSCSSASTMKIRLSKRSAVSSRLTSLRAITLWTSAWMSNLLMITRDVVKVVAMAAAVAAADTEAKTHNTAVAAIIKTIS